MNKTEAYDTHILPLVRQLEDACKRHNLALLACVGIDPGEGLGYRLTFHMKAEAEPPYFLAAGTLLLSQRVGEECLSAVMDAVHRELAAVDAEPE